MNPNFIGYNNFSMRDEKIIDIVNQTISLLKNNNENHWSTVLESLLQDYKSSDNKSEVAELFIKIMRGGMGSFLDLVLHKNGKPLIEENN